VTSDVTAHERILRVLDDYFRGIYTGQVERLRSAFHPSATLWGEVKGLPYYKALDDYLVVVRGRKSPEALGEPFAMEPISIEVHGKIALAKVRCKMLGYCYIDFLSLLRQDDRWAIVAKVFTHDYE
jgi:hypothetical protein